MKNGANRSNLNPILFIKGAFYGMKNAIFANRWIWGYTVLYCLKSGYLGFFKNGKEEKFMLSVEGKYLGLLCEEVIDVRPGNGDNIEVVISGGHKITVDKNNIYVHEK